MYICTILVYIPYTYVYRYMYMYGYVHVCLYIYLCSCVRVVCSVYCVSMYTYYLHIGTKSCCTRWIAVSECFRLFTIYETYSYTIHVLRHSIRYAQTWAKSVCNGKCGSQSRLRFYRKRKLRSVHDARTTEHVIFRPSSNTPTPSTNTFLKWGNNVFNPKRIYFRWISGPKDMVVL